MAGIAATAALLAGALQLLVAHSAVTVTPCMAASAASVAAHTCASVAGPCGVMAKNCVTAPELRNDGHGLVAPALHVAVSDPQMVFVPETLGVGVCAASACDAVRNTAVGVLEAAHFVGKLVVHKAAVHAAVPLATN